MSSVAFSVLFYSFKNLGSFFSILHFQSVKICYTQIQSHFSNQGDEIEIGSSLSDFNRFDLDKPEENLKLIVETIKKGLETFEKEKYKAKNFTGTCVYKFSKDCLKWKIGFSKESEIVRVNDYKFHIELTRMEEKRESFVKFFVYCEGVYEHEWRAKVHLKLQIEILDPKTRIGKRRVQDAKKLSEKMNHEFKWTNSGWGGNCRLRKVGYAIGSRERQ